jgi:serine/threonine protein kinase
LDRIGAVLVDTYRIERLIAEGGMGAVYEASHLRIPKKFAIKFLKVSLLDNSVALLRFRREAEVIATLDHPHIVGLFDYNLTDDGVPYTVLEMVEGEHLGDRVSRGRMPLADALRVAEAVAGALSTAHDKGVIHRDLKPENVILGTKGAIKVVDFGIAKLRGGQELTAFNSILGTITYMAPEQLMAGHIDGRADQFALAAITYEMLSGDMPFGSEGSIPEIAERVLRQQPAAIAGYPPSVHEVLLRGMAKEQDKRFPNVDAFFEALRDATRPLLEAARVEAGPQRTPSKPAALPAASPTVPVAVPVPPVVPASPPPLPASVSAQMVSPVPSTSPATPPAPPVAPITAEREAAEVLGGSTDVGLPELPGEQTSISMTPLPASTSGPIANGAPNPNDVPTGETELQPETTRITRSPSENERVRAETIRPGELQRAAPNTGRMAALRDSIVASIVARLGRRGRVAVGVIIGVVIAVAASLIWR